VTGGHRYQPGIELETGTSRHFSRATLNCGVWRCCRVSGYVILDKYFLFAPVDEIVRCSWLAWEHSAPAGQLVLDYFPVEPLIKFVGAGQFDEKLPVRGINTSPDLGQPRVLEFVG